MSNLVSSPKNVVYVNGGQTYNVSAADDVINVNSNLGATEIVLPNIVNQGLDFYPKKFTINDTGGMAGTNPITVSAVGNVVNSGTSLILNRDYVSSEVVIVSKTEYLVNTDNGGSTGIFGSGTVGQLAYFTASTVVGSLTNTQVTALLNVFTGDSGSGGVKGLVPAPSAGDAAANKYLKADGTWTAISLSGYLKADGTVPLTANWDAGLYEITGSSFRANGTAGNGHIHLRYQSAIPTGAANNSKIFAGATGALGWVVDSNAYAFYLDMTGNTASRTLTAPDASGTIALTSDVLNIYNNSSTITNDARVVTLKAGGTADQYLQIANDGGGNLLQLRGSKLIEFGSTSNAIKADYYLDSALNDQIRIFSGSSVFANFNPSTTRYSLDMVNPSTGASVGISARYGQISVTGAAANPAGYYGFDSGGNQVITLDCQSDNDGYLLLKTNNTGKIGLYAGYGNYFQDNVSIGQDYTFTAKLNVKGAGSTAATQTALFQNSSGAALLTILDSGRVIQNLSSSVISDSDLAVNTVNFYTDGTYLLGRYKNNSSVSSDLVIGNVTLTGSQTLTNKTLSSPVFSGTASGAFSTSGSITTTSTFSCRGILRMNGSVSGNPLMYDVQDQSGNLVIEMGRQDGSGSVVAYDFHTGATAVDYDFRMQSSGGTGVAGGGAMDFFGTTFRFNSASVLTTSNTATLTNKTLTSSTNVLGGVTMTLGSDASGDMYYRNSSGLLTRIAAGAQNTQLSMGASSVPTWSIGSITQFSQTASTTIASSTTETTLTNTGAGSLTVAANTMLVGTNFRIKARGYISNTGSPFIQIKIKIGSVTIMDTGSTGMFAITGDQQWEISADFTVRAAGASANVIGQGIFYYATAASTQEQMVFTTNTAVSSNFDSTASQAIDVTAQWNTSSASNSITCTNLIIEKFN